MAERAGSRRTVELAGGSHTVGIPEAGSVVDLIREAATVGVGSKAGVATAAMRVATMSAR